VPLLRLKSRAVRDAPIPTLTPKAYTYVPLPKSEYVAFTPKLAIKSPPIDKVVLFPANV